MGNWPLPLALLAGLALAGCDALLPPTLEIEEPVQPLSKVYVNNATDAGFHVRMNWPDRFVQTSWVGAHSVVALTGAIGTSGFPETIDVLTSECELVTSLPGLAPGNAGIVTISGGGARLDWLERADAAWVAVTVPSIEECGANPLD